jgi:hypothetical protein
VIPSQGRKGEMKDSFKRRYWDWNPIQNPVVQNTLMGFVLGIMVGINLKAIYERIHGPAFVWISFFAFGTVIGFLSGLERIRMEKKNPQKKRGNFN